MSVFQCLWLLGGAALAVRCKSVAEARYGSVRARVELVMECPGKMECRRAATGEFGGGEALDEQGELVYKLVQADRAYPLAARSLKLAVCAASGTQERCSAACRVPCALADPPGNFTYTLRRSGSADTTGSRRMPRFYCPEGAARYPAKAEYPPWFVGVVSAAAVVGFLALVALLSWCYVRRKRGMPLLPCGDRDPMAKERARLKREDHARRTRQKSRMLGVRSKKVESNGFGNAARLI